MFARQLGWYHSVPKPRKQSRLAELKEKEQEPTLPECEAAYLVPFFYESGMASAGFNGYTPLEWQEINAWLEATNTQLSTWEVVAIKAMSKAYVEEYTKANEDVNCEPPMLEKVDTEMTPEKRSTVHNALKERLSAIKQSKKGM